jgi:hypothetical protein
VGQRPSTEERIDAVAGMIRAGHTDLLTGGGELVRILVESDREVIAPYYEDLVAGVATLAGRVQTGKLTRRQALLELGTLLDQPR